jgi:hypothetical protein
MVRSKLLKPVACRPSPASAASSCRLRSAKRCGAIEIFVIAGAIYLAINFVLTRALMFAEYRLTPYLRQPVVKAVPIRMMSMEPFYLFVFTHSPTQNRFALLLEMLQLSSEGQTS